MFLPDPSDKAREVPAQLERSRQARAGLPPAWGARPQLRPQVL